MSVLLITSWYPPPHAGGSVIFLYNIASNLPPTEVIVLTNSGPNDADFDAIQPYKIIRNRFIINKFDKIAQGRTLVGWTLHMFRLLRQKRVEVIHVGDIFIPGIIAWFAYRWWGIPYILYVYAEELTQQFHRQDCFWGALKGRIYRRIIQNAARYIVVSDYTTGLLGRFGVSQEKILKVIPMVAPSSPVEPGLIESLRLKYGLLAEQKIILTVGRLITRKGQDHLIRAMQKVIPRFPDSKLIIVGQGPEFDRLCTLANTLKIQESLVFTGFISGQDIQALYEICDIFAMPHRELDDGDTEGCPTVFLEAAAHGKPAIGGLAGGVADAIIDGETGILVDGNQIDEIAEAIIRLLRDPELRIRLGNAGRSRVQQELGPAIGANKVLKFSHSVGKLKKKY